jgi:uncharacterized protein (TIGR02452 family)
MPANPSNNNPSYGALPAPGSLSEGEWDPSAFLMQLQQARASGDKHRDKKVLAQVAQSNYGLRFKWKVPRTNAVTYQQCKASRVQGKGKDPVVSFSTLSTADAVLALASGPNGRQRRLCALNFANGEHVGGGYKNGATAQEEDLCRRIPSLYTSLYNASKAGLYPFGPCTADSASRPNKYCDVLYTKGLVIGRANIEMGYRLLSPSEQVTFSLVTAAAPNVNFANEIYDLELIAKTINSIFVAPRLEEPNVNTLILGAWGCGAFGCRPEDIADLFGRALASGGMGRLYDEIHFAMLDPEGHTAAVFRKALQKHGVKVTDLR